jgi:hypothetical protein
MSLDTGPIPSISKRSVPSLTTRSVLFDSHMVVLGVMRGAPRSLSITLSCELNAEDVSALHQWNNRAKFSGYVGYHLPARVCSSGV